MAMSVGRNIAARVLRCAQSPILVSARRSYATEAPLSSSHISETNGPVTRTISLPRKASPESALGSTPEASPVLSGIIRKALPYSVSRTPTRGLPVYQLAKSGGNLKLTRVRKLEGDIEVLRKQLEETLSPKPEYVKINPTTNHIMIKVCRPSGRIEAEPMC